MKEKEIEFRRREGSIASGRELGRWEERERVEIEGGIERGKKGNVR